MHRLYQALADGGGLFGRVLQEGVRARVGPPTASQDTDVVFPVPCVTRDEVRKWACEGKFDCVDFLEEVCELGNLLLVSLNLLYAGGGAVGYCKPTMAQQRVAHGQLLSAF